MGTTSSRTTIIRPCSTTITDSSNNTTNSILTIPTLVVFGVVVALCRSVSSVVWLQDGKPFPRPLQGRGQAPRRCVEAMVDIPRVVQVRREGPEGCLETSIAQKIQGPVAAVAGASGQSGLHEGSHGEGLEAGRRRELGFVATRGQRTSRSHCNKT